MITNKIGKHVFFSNAVGIFTTIFFALYFSHDLNGNLSWSGELGVFATLSPLLLGPWFILFGVARLNGCTDVGLSITSLALAVFSALFYFYVFTKTRDNSRVFVFAIVPAIQYLVAIASWTIISLSFRRFLILFLFSLIISALTLTISVSSPVGAVIAGVLAWPMDMAIFFSFGDWGLPLFKIFGLENLLEQGFGWGNVAYPIVLGIVIGSFVNTYLVVLIWLLAKSHKQDYKVEQLKR